MRASIRASFIHESKRSFSSRGEVSARASRREDPPARLETLKRDETFRRDRPNPNPPPLARELVRVVRARRARDGAGGESAGVVANASDGARCPLEDDRDRFAAASTAMASAKEGGARRRCS